MTTIKEIGVTKFFFSSFNKIIRCVLNFMENIALDFGQVQKTALYLKLLDLTSYCSNINDFLQVLQPYH